MAVLYSDELQKNHYSQNWSKSFCITFWLIISIVVMPFILVYRTHSK